MSENKLSKPALYVPLAIVCCLLWSSAFAFIKLGYAHLHIDSGDYASQILFAGLRFALAGVLTVVLASFVVKKPLVPKSGRTAAHIGILALVQTLAQYALFYFALAKIKGSAGSVLNSAGSFFCVLLSAAVFADDKLNISKILGCVLGFGGIVLLHMRSLQPGFHLAGEGFMLLSALCYALSAVLMKRFAQTDSPALLSGWQFFAGGIGMCVIGLLTGGSVSKMNAAAVGIIVYLAFVSAAAYTLWSILLKYNPVSKIAVFGFVIPVGGVVLSAWILKETFPLVLSIVCLALVSVGIVLVNLGKKPLQR